MLPQLVSFGFVDGGAEMVVKHNCMHAVARIRADVFERKPEEIWACCVHEFMGMLRAIEKREGNIPAVGALICTHEDPQTHGRIWEIKRLGRNANDWLVRIGDGEFVRWEDCRYVDLTELRPELKGL